METSIIKPPSVIEPRGKFSVFLAGSIEIGAAEDWRVNLQDSLSGLHIDIYNPRRDNWDPTWEQTACNLQFREQVEWELEALRKADLILMYLQPGTKDPASLLKLGLYASSGKLAVCCPKGFLRKGNVDIVCQTYNIKTVSTLEGLADHAIEVYSQKMRFKTLRDQALEILSEDQKYALSFFPIKLDCFGNFK